MMRNDENSILLKNVENEDMQHRSLCVILRAKVHESKRNQAIADPILEAMLQNSFFHH
jgi:hypothetical protein